MDDRRVNFENMLFAVKNGKHTIVKHVVDKEGDNSEE